MHLDPAIALGIRLGFALLFGTAFLHKLLYWRAFEATLVNYTRGVDRMGAARIRLLAVLVAGSELAVAGMSAASPHGPLTALAIAALLLGYAGAMLVNLRRGNVLMDCGCNWGMSRQPLRHALVVRNIGLASLASILAIPLSGRSLGALDGLSACAAVITAAVLYMALNGLLAHVTPNPRSTP